MIREAVTTVAALVLLACSGDRGESSAAARPHPSASASGRPLPPSTAPSRRLLFLGTSLTAGLGVEADSAYPALIQRRLDSLGLRYQVANAGVSGETAAGGLRRADWLFREPFAVLVLELGANDGLRGTDPDSVEATLQRVIDLARARSPDAVILLAGMEAPPNFGPRYTARFRGLFRQLAQENRLVLIPFLLDGVAGVDSLNQADRIHPNSRGHRLVADHVWRALEPALPR